jgi:predicted RNase H-like HicB family nuclease
MNVRRVGAGLIYKLRRGRCLVNEDPHTNGADRDGHGQDARVTWGARRVVEGGMFILPGGEDADECADAQRPGRDFSQVRRGDTISLMRANSTKASPKTSSRRSYTYTVLIHPAEADEKGYWVEVPALPGCFTRGRTIEQCIERAREAIAGHIRSLIELGQSVPEEPNREDALQVKVNLRVPA